MSNFRTISKLLFSLLTVVLAFSCQQEKKKTEFEKRHGDVLATVLVNEDGLFRGLNLGDSMQVVLRKEPNQPMDQDETSLYYEYKIDTTASYLLTYDFDERGLLEIKADILINNNVELMEDIYSKFKTYLDNHFGGSERQGGFEAWSVKSDKYNEVKIDLNQEAPAFDSGIKRSKISLWIYPEE